MNQPAGPVSRGFAWLRREINLRLIIATLVALALFGYVVDIAVHGDLAGGLHTIVVQVGLLAFALMIPYFVLRGVTWLLLLKQLGVRPPIRIGIAAFSAGELTKSLPGGPYLETYVLARLERLDERHIVSTAMATMGSDVMVGAVAFLAAMVIGLPAHDWFRWLLVAIAGAWIVIYGVVWLAVKWWRPQERVQAARWSRTVGRIVGEITHSAARLVRPQVAGPLLTTVGYLALNAVVMWLVLAVTDVRGDSMLAAVRVITITSLANVLIPIPTDIGVTELTGVGVLSAHGVPTSDAAIVMLGHRLLTTGSLTIIGLGVVAYLRSAFSEQPRQ